MRYLGSVFTLLFMVAFLAGCMPVGERESCVSQEPDFSEGEAGYELFDLQHKEVWLTLDFTAQEYAEFSPPFLWVKNDPRVGVADKAEFLRSPGCSDEGQFTYMQAFDKEFLNVVRFMEMNVPTDTQGLIRMIKLEKYHLLTYFSGRTVNILQSPTGERYIEVSRSVDRLSDTFTLPEGWTLTEQYLETDLQVELSGNVSVLRTDNEDSYQGPLPDGIFVRPFDVDPEEYPFRSCAFQTAVGRIHYFDEGPRDANETILMVHGNPTWSFLYRNIAKAMIEDGHRVIALDHLGMGMSDVPLTCEFDYRPRSHADHLEDLVVALDLRNITLVVQDWGGPIGLGMATQQPERISRMLIMNTWAWSIDAEEPGDFHELVSWTVNAKRFASFYPTWFCGLALPGQSRLNAAEADPSNGSLYESVLSAYLSPAIDAETGAYRTSEPCAPMQIFAESIGDDDAFQGEIEGRMENLQGKPYSLLFGLSDPLFGPLRCNTAAISPCPDGSACSCDEELLPARINGGCSDLASTRFRVCKEPDGSIIEPYADRFEDLLGKESLVSREGVRDADHMIQEWAPERVIQALRNLLAYPGAE